MNTKGIKFLAVLAVLAMVFAAFAVIAPAEENDATNATATDSENFAAVSTAVADGKKYYVGTTGVLEAPEADAEITVYVKSGVTATLTGGAAGITLTATVYVAETGTDGTSATYYTGYSAKFVVAGNAVAKTIGLTATGSAEDPLGLTTAAALDGVTTTNAYKTHYITDGETVESIAFLIPGKQAIAYTDEYTFDKVTIPVGAVGKFTITDNGDATTNEVSITYVAASAGVTATAGIINVTAGAAKALSMTSGDNASDATVSVDKGSVTLSASNSFKATANLNFISTKAITGAATVGAATLAPAATGAMAASVFVYGSVDDSTFHTIGAYTVGFVNASGKFSFGLAGEEITNTMTLVDATFTAQKGEVVTSIALSVFGAKAGNISLTKGEYYTAESPSTYPTDEMTISAGVVLNIEGDADIEGKIYVSGEMNGVDIDGTPKYIGKSTELTVGTVDNYDAVFKTRAGGVLSDITFNPASLGTVDVSASMKEITLDGTIQTTNTYDATQIVNIPSDLTITKGVTITINGQVNLAPGATITIEKNSTLRITGATAVANLEGTVDVQNGTFAVAGAKEINVTGKILVEDDGTLSTSGVFTLEEGAVATVEGTLIVPVAGIIVESGATLTVMGDLDTTEAILNKGTIVLDGAVLINNDGQITQNGDGAVVDIKSVIVSNLLNLIIDDDGLEFKIQNVVDTEQDWNKITISSTAAQYGIAGLKVTQAASGKLNKAGNAITVTNKMYLSGSIDLYSIADPVDDGQYPQVSLTTEGNNLYNGFVVSDSLTLNAKGADAANSRTLDVGAQLSISGTVNVSKDSRMVADVANSKITVTGTLQLYDETNHYNKFKAKLNAAEYKAGDNLYIVTSLGSAVEAAAAVADTLNIKVAGSVSLTANTEIPANARISGTDNTPNITIGSVTKDCSVIVEEGASISVNIAVETLLFVENSKNVTGTVTSDVKVTNGKTATYTNITRALADAEVGDVVEVTKTEGKFQIKTDLTIPAGVTLVLSDAIDTEIVAGNPATPKTITVDGALYMVNDIDGFRTAGEIVDKFVINGFVRVESSTAAHLYEVYKTPAAYFEDDGYIYITTLAQAAFAEAEDIDIYGAVTETSEVIFIGEDAKARIDVMANSSLSVADLTLMNAQIVPEAASSKVTGMISGPIGGEIGGDVASVIVTNYYGTIDDTEGATAYTFSIGRINSTITVLAGEVTLAAGTVDADSILTIAAGATLINPNGQALNLNQTANIVGTLVTGGALTLNSDNVVLTGTINVVRSTSPVMTGSLTITRAVLETGEINVDKGADFVVNRTIALGEKPTTLGASGIKVVGDITALNALCYIVVYPGADVSEMTIQKGEGEISLGTVTAFILNGAEYMTVYGAPNSAVTIATVLGAEEFELEGYEESYLKLQDVKTWGLDNTSTLGNTLAGLAEVQADDVTIAISVGAGIQLYIDDIRVESDKDVDYAVGTHTVKAMVEPGYKGTINITFNGKAVTDGKFTITVDMTNVPVVSATGDIQIDPGESPEPTPEEKSDWTITTILLVVLVILIAILVVVLILRLNRS